MSRQDRDSSVSSAVFDEKTRTYSSDELAQLSASESADSTEYVEPHRPPRPYAGDAAADRIARDDVVTVRPGRVEVNVEDDAPPERRMRGIVMWAGLGMLFAILVPAALLLGPRWEPLEPLRAAVVGWVRSAKSVGSASAQAKTASPKVIRLNIGATPAEARLYVDGELVSNPLYVERPVDNMEHELRAEAPRYRTIRRKLRFERDLTVMLELGALSGDAASPGPAAGKPQAKPARRAWSPAVRRQGRRQGRRVVRAKPDPEPEAKATEEATSAPEQDTDSTPEREADSAPARDDESAPARDDESAPEQDTADVQAAPSEGAD